jgi:hypothetical protein
MWGDYVEKHSVAPCVELGLVGGEGFAVDASVIQADASDRNRVEGAAGPPPTAVSRAVAEI